VVEDLYEHRDARRVVVAAYARMETVLRRHGLPRAAGETQTEFLHRVLPQLEGEAGAACILTALFERARFSAHVIDDDMKQSAITAFLGLRSALGGGGAPPSAAPFSDPDGTTAETHVTALTTRLVAVAPIRAALGLTFLGVSRVVGSPSGSALLAFAVGAVALVVTAVADPRKRLPQRQPRPLPPNAVHDTLCRAALGAAFPSTAVLSVLATIALLRQPVLTACLGGVLLGLGAAALYGASEVTRRERRLGGRLYLDRVTNQLYL
jgi:hypothetical protein